MQKENKKSSDCRCDKKKPLKLANGLKEKRRE